MPGLSDFDSLTRLEGATDSTPIGNVGDMLKNILAPTSSSGTLGALNATFDFDNSTYGYGSILVQVTGTWSGTITPQYSLDNSTFATAELRDNSISYSSITANGLFCIPYSKYLRMKMTAYTSGTANIYYFATANGPLVQRTEPHTQRSSSAGVTQNQQLTNIDTEHRQIHSQLSYHAWTVLSVGSGVVTYYVFTPVQGTAHTVWEIHTDGALTIDIFECTIGTATQNTLITNYNRARFGSATTSTTTLYTVTGTPTVGTVQIDSKRLGNATGSSEGYFVQRGQEWDMTTAKEYIFRITSHNSNNNISFALDWYHTS